MPRFFILLPIPITLDWLPFFCAFVFHSSWTNEAFPSRHVNTTHTPHFGHESRPAFPASLSHTHTQVQKTLQRSLGQAKTQLYGAVATRYSPAQAEWGLDTKQDERETLSCWIISSSFSKHFSPLHFLGCAWHTLNSLRPHAVDLCLLAVDISTLARNPSLPHKRFLNYDLQLLILNS